MGINFTSDILEFIKSKNSCIVTKEIERLMVMLGCRFNKKRPTSEVMREAIFNDSQEASLLEMSVIPSTLAEFKNSKFFTLPSILKKYQGFSPCA
jgi:hypothetical protein